MYFVIIFSFQVRTTLVEMFSREKKKIGHFCQFLTFESLTTETRSLMEFLRENVCNKEDFLLIVSNFFFVSSYNAQCLALDICKKSKKKRKLLAL